MEAFLASAAAGAITAPMNHRWSAQEAIGSVASLAPKLLMVDHSCAELGMQVAAAMRGMRAMIWLGYGPHDTEKPCHHRCLMAEDIIARNICGSGGSFVQDFELRQAPDGVALICFTSGTSGQSKGAMISHAALLGQAMTKVIMAGYNSMDTYLHTAPLFHIGGLSYAIALMSVGAR
jgi:acyl-activating enzyme 14